MWRPTASMENIRLRAQLLTKIRTFFSERSVLEIETPLLSQTTVPDCHIHSITASLSNETFYLQTSPEFAMKRLLAAGSGSIYQICKAFRNDELGKQHNPEFTMLEWYRVGFDHHQLMNEMDQLLSQLLNSKPAIKLSYQAVFKKHLNVDPLTTSIKELKQCADENKITTIGFESTNRDDWLNLLMSYCIEPKLTSNINELLQPFFITDFPISQAALAKQSQQDPRVAERFELYINGIELANGFHELTDANEQRRRFENDLRLRQQAGLPAVSIDEDFLAALEQGLPDCAGVALGIDRLLMLLAGEEKIGDVLCFH